MRIVVRILGLVFGIVVIACGLLWPLATSLGASGSVSPPNDSAKISIYEGRFDVSDSGLLTATETITAEFPGGKHGIFRYFDMVDPAAPGVRLDPEIISISMDGKAVPYELRKQEGRFLVAKIGDPAKYLDPGTHVYKLRYTVAGAISPPTAGTGEFVSTTGSNDGDPGSVFYWNVVAQGWEMPIGTAVVVVNLPDNSGVVQCSAGTYDNDGKPGPCQIQGAGTAQVTVSARDIPPRTGMTVRAAMAMAAPERSELPWSIRFDAVLGRSVPLVLVVLVLSVLAFGLGWYWARRAKEPEPGFPVMYAPPEGMGPVQTVYMESESVGSHAAVATMLYLADRGYVTLEQVNDKTWRLSGRTEAQYWDRLDPVSARVGELLGVTVPGGQFVADGRKGSGLVLSQVNTAIPEITRSWARDAGLIERATRETLTQIAVVIGGLAAIAGFISLLGPTMYGLPGALLFLGGVGLLRTGVGTRRTLEGRQAWSRAGGFKRLLSTPSAEDRFDFAARKDLFLAYVPYAAAFGCADKWAAKYRMATGEEPPIPLWYPYGLGAAGLYSSGGGFDSFDSALSNSISAYSASQSSGSGGGGGGGGGFGGGGGGGGGGSW